MKKVLLVLFVLGICTSFAMAGVGITWTTIYGAYDHSAANLTSGDDLLLDSFGAIWQLLYAGADNVANDVDLSNSANGYVSGDDDVWGQRTIPLGGNAGGSDSGDAPFNTTWDNWMSQQTGVVVYQDLAWNTAGFVFQRVFEGTPAAGSWYYQSPLLAIDTGYSGGGSAAQDFALDTSDSGFQPNQQLIPEPATMGLLGLGALVMAIRRRRS